MRISRDVITSLGHATKAERARRGRRPGMRNKDAGSIGQCHEMGAGARSAAAEHHSQMGLYGALTEVQCSRDIFGNHAECHKSEHLDLAGREVRGAATTSSCCQLRARLIHGAHRSNALTIM